MLFFGKLFFVFWLVWNIIKDAPFKILPSFKTHSRVGGSVNHLVFTCRKNKDSSWMVVHYDRALNSSALHGAVLNHAWRSKANVSKKFCNVSISFRKPLCTACAVHEALFFKAHFFMFFIKISIYCLNYIWPVGWDITLQFPLYWILLFVIIIVNIQKHFSNI